jgi:hypothetical protein
MTQTSSPTRYVTLNETNQLIRLTLKNAFPSVRFSVRGSKYSGGASTQVSWTDGPSDAAVREITRQFEGKSFDGMTDMASSNFLTESDGSRIHYGSDYVFTGRTTSPARQAEIEELIASWGFPVEDGRRGSFPTPIELHVMRQNTEGFHQSFYEMTDTNELVGAISEMQARSAE